MNEEKTIWKQRRENLSTWVRAQPLLAVGTGLLAGYFLARLSARLFWR